MINDQSATQAILLLQREGEIFTKLEQALFSKRSEGDNIGNKDWGNQSEHAIGCIGKTDWGKPGY